MKKSLLFKLLVAGDAAVGKTTLLHRYVNGEFVDTMTMTIGVDFFTKILQIGKQESDTNVQLQLWDLGGQERFRFMHEAYLRGAHGALLLFDTTSMKSFVNIQKWENLLRKFDHDLPILLVGTKYDLEEFSMVADYYAELTQKRFSMFDYIKTSSKWGLNINESFETMVHYLIKTAGLGEEVSNK